MDKFRRAELDKLEEKSKRELEILVADELKKRGWVMLDSMSHEEGGFSLNYSAVREADGATVESKTITNLLFDAFNYKD